ncbi:acyl-CoA N-acyltransferase [Microstroma glucosiphilum]|uniref:Glucosamine 6-phosphate N-acetyltransferase n=1 Tax=Pseudomicrostroma glucosiphilum TaxID=1684307 RepID=A0A316UG09_9BASI|nr:acyl-CoA N-acyltransferase [Pseudomicrostroma glucosiphilum]PWN23844.1 acyl-CoA N-acyltransferase [Pseudomicrostroma glucosiphilum]
MTFTPDSELELIFDAKLIPQSVKEQLPEDLHIRPLASDDYTRGHLTVLSVLTKAPDVGLTSWQEQFRLLSSIPNTYYPLVIVSRSTDQIVAMGTLVMELKFLRGNAKAGHVEDIVVSSQAQGRGLGKKVIQALTGISESLGAYKVILDCSEENAPFYEKCGYKHAGVEMAKYAS